MISSDSTRRTAVLTLGLAALATAASAQVRWEGQPVSADADLPALQAAVVSAVPDIPRLQAEDYHNETNRLSVPFRYGMPMRVTGNMETAGEWTSTPEGDLIWRLRVTAPGAKSIGLQFDDWYMPAGSKMFVYDDSRDNVFGAYDARNMNPDNLFVIEPFPGETAIIEYQQPAWVDDTPRISLEYLIYDYRDIIELQRRWDSVENFAQDGEGGEEGGCEIPVNCSQGDPFPNQKRSTLRTFFFGGLCSASLINNTANDGTRYVYTANHCGQGSQTVFRFNYEGNGCSFSGAPTGQNLSGATLLANHAASDGRLLRINNAIPDSWDPYFSGWSRSTANMSFGMSMHHPGGSPKCIAIDSNGGGSGQSVFIDLGVINVWFMVFQQGGTIGGSSGAPLFDQNDRIRGTLSGGPANCAFSNYGRLNSFWNNSSISNFLDPIGQGSISIDGFDPDNPGGGNDPPEVTGISPVAIEAVRVDTEVTITITGTGFTGTTGVTMDGIQLENFPPQFTVVSDSVIQIIDPPQTSSLGLAQIVIQHPDGNANTAVNVIANDPPVTELAGSSPSFLISGAGLTLFLGGDVGDLFFLSFSGDLVPSALPGFVNWDIGNNFSTLFGLGNYTVGAEGYVALNFPLTGSFAGVTIHMQSAVLDASGLPTIFPLTMTNTQTGTFLF